MFLGFKREFNELKSDLAQISKDTWWKEEVHIDAYKLYELCYCPDVVSKNDT